MTLLTAMNSRRLMKTTWFDSCAGCADSVLCVLESAELRQGRGYLNGMTNVKGGAAFRRNVIGSVPKAALARLEEEVVFLEGGDNLCG